MVFSDAVNRESNRRFKMMTSEQAWRLITSVCSLDVYNVVFETINDVDVEKMLHLFWEYDMVVPAVENRLTLFVGRDEQSCKDVFEFVRHFLSEDGTVLPARPWNSFSKRFQDTTLRERFSNGSAKLITIGEFFDLFVCKCSKITRIHHQGLFDPMLSFFVSNLCEDFGDSDNRRRVTLLRCLRCGNEDDSLGISSDALTPGNSVANAASELQRSLGETSTVLAGVGERPPLFKKEVGRAQHRFSWNYFRVD